MTSTTTKLEPASKTLIIWGFVLIAMAPVAIFGFAIFNFLVVSLGIASDSIFTIVVNTILFIIGAIGVPGLLVGLVFLIMGFSRRSKSHPNTR